MIHRMARHPGILIPPRHLFLPRLPYVRPNEAEALDSLKESLVENGQLEPILVRRMPDGQAMVVHGRRRALAFAALLWEGHQIRHVRTLPLPDKLDGSRLQGADLDAQIYLEANRTADFLAEDIGRVQRWLRSKGCGSVEGRRRKGAIAREMLARPRVGAFATGSTQTVQGLLGAVNQLPGSTRKDGVLRFLTLVIDYLDGKDSGPGIAAALLAGHGE